MPTRITLAPFGDVQLSRTILRTSEFARDLTPVWQVLARRFQAIEARQFSTEGGYGGGSGGHWAPLSPDYAAWKARAYPGKPILERTGALKASLTGGAGYAEHITPETIYLGTEIPYARYHQLGTPRMPARKPIELPSSERNKWVQAVQRWIVRGVAPEIT